MKIFKFIFVVFGIFVVLSLLSSMFRGCGNSEYQKAPLDILIKDLNERNYDRYSILLYDMDVDGSFVSTYRHKYQVIAEKGEEVKEFETSWYELNEKRFKKYQDYMGMVVASKEPGNQAVKKISPPGYDNYIGNSKYGQWRTNSNGNTFWEFYGKYALLTSLFDLGSHPVRRTYYRNYRDQYARGKTYLGPNANLYGTKGRFTKGYSSGSRWYTKASNKNFRSKVRSRVSSSNRKSRTSGRSGSGFFRSRSSGFGK